METEKSQETIRKDLEDNSVKVAQIGPEGEKKVRYAAVINDMNHVAGRCGMGEVMGSKNLKAIVVKRNQNVNVENPKSVRQLAQWMARYVDDITHDLNTFGTGSAMDVYEATGNLPVHNLRDGEFPNVNSISAQAVKEHVRVGMETCFTCAIQDRFFTSEIPKRYKGLGILETVPIEDLGSKKIRLFKYVATWRSLSNCLVMCLFVPWSVQQKVNIVRSVTGWNTTTFELMKVSERTIDLAMVFNISEGFTEKDDWLPLRFFKPKTSGALSDTAVNSEMLRKAKSTYYAMMGWDGQGVLTQTKLEELDIAWVRGFSH